MEPLASKIRPKNLEEFFGQAFADDTATSTTYEKHKR